MDILNKYITNNCALYNADTVEAIKQSRTRAYTLKFIVRLLQVSTHTVIVIEI